ncbi:sugar ABC transporter substrate-binding protein [Mesorhizobium sp. PUT5]|uniref:sugar ABC transporter substrate-binding protein n=1 Tax=Mesorhizobium sp. PUT5 TaxID=3454629 RepID=UPI003FA498BB
MRYLGRILAGSALAGTLFAGSMAFAAAPNICVVHNGADHPSITALVAGMDDEAKIFGATVTYFDPALDPVKQVSMIEDCTSRKPDVIVVNTVDPAAVVPAIAKASEAGIPVLTQNADTNADGRAYTKAFVGSQSFDQGYAVGEMINTALGGKGKVAVITGKVGQTDSVNRTAGMEAAFKDASSGIEVIAVQPADWSKDRALTVMQDLLTRFPEIDAVFGHDDPMALGALEAIKAQGRQGEIKVFGVNGNKEACAAIKNGEMYGTALQMSYLVGVYTVRAAYDVTNGRLIPRTILAPTAAVTPDTVDNWMAQCW